MGKETIDYEIYVCIFGFFAAWFFVYAFSFGFLSLRV